MVDNVMENVLKRLNEKDFNPETYVRELSNRCVGGQELQRIRRQIQYQAERTSGTLKKNVYENYMQFIDTAKEISHLESEMYQLSHLLSEQRLLLSTLADTTLLVHEHATVEIEDTKKDSDEEMESKKQKLVRVMEKVEGCSNIFEIPGRTLIYHDDLIEIDPVDNSQIQHVHGYLLSDSFMLAPWLPDRCEPIRYRFEILYELSSLAVINVRDLGSIKYAFKILAFPDTRVFQCNSSSSKKEWLMHFDTLKKARLNQDGTLKNREQRSPSRTMSIDGSHSNPFEEDEEPLTPIHTVSVIEHPEWFLEVPEDLDVLVAQRHFEEALTLLNRARDYINEIPIPLDSVVTEIQRKVEMKHTTLTETLMRELEMNADKSLQGGLRAARRAVRLLNQLDRSTQSCDLFLQLCSSILRTQCKRVKREGSASIYVKQLSSVVFTNMCHMADEFLRAFPQSPSCAAAFIVWAGSELNVLTSHLIKQVFVPQTSLSTLTECVVLVRIQCERLCHFGIDLCYQLNGALRNPFSKTLRETRDKLVDTVKLRASDDKWIPMNLLSKQKLNRFLQEYAQLGVKLDKYVTGDCWLQLTMNTLTFIKLYRSLIDDCLRLQTPELLHSVDETLYGVMKAQLRYIETALSNQTQNDTRDFMIKNGMFLLETFLPLIEDKYEECIGFRCELLSKLHNEHAALQQGHVPAARSFTKYSSEEYL